MANYDVTTLPASLRGGERAALSRAGGNSGEGYFSDVELAAAQQLVMMSGSSSEDMAVQAAEGASSSSSSSSYPSVCNSQRPLVETAAAGEDEDGEEMSTGPITRRRRFRSIRVIYAITSPIAGGFKRKNAPQSRKPIRE